MAISSQTQPDRTMLGLARKEVKWCFIENYHNHAALRQRMTWKGRHPIIKTMSGTYLNGVSVMGAEMKTIELRLERSSTLPKYDILIRPRE